MSKTYLYDFSKQYLCRNDCWAHVEDRLGAGWRIDSESKWVRLAASIHDVEDDKYKYKYKYKYKDDYKYNDGDADNENDDDDEESKWIGMVSSTHQMVSSIHVFFSWITDSTTLWWIKFVSVTKRSECRVKCLHNGQYL